MTEPNVDEKGEYLLALHQFSQRIKDHVAEDIVEHGVPHADRAVTIRDIEKKLAEAASLLFEVSQELYALIKQPEAHE